MKRSTDANKAYSLWLLVISHLSIKIDRKYRNETVNWCEWTSYSTPNLIVIYLIISKYSTYTLQYCLLYRYNESIRRSDRCYKIVQGPKWKVQLLWKEPTFSDFTQILYFSVGAINRYNRLLFYTSISPCGVEEQISKNRSLLLKSTNE